MPLRPLSFSARTFLSSALFLFAAAFAFVSLAAGQKPTPSSPTKQTKATRVSKEIQHDLSPALRDLPERAPFRASDRELARPRRRLRTHKVGAGKKLPDPVVQSSPAAANMPSSTQNFDGLPNVNGVLPPDTNGAVGPNHYVQWVNLSFAIYDKSGNLLYGPADGSTLWSGFGGPCELSNDGDPIVLHDSLADRWVMSQLAVPNFPFGPFYQCIAVSQTADPTGAYYRYEFETSATKLNDYPKFGVWTDGYYMAVNQFDEITLGFSGQGVVAFERDMMLAGRAARMIYFDLAGVDPNLGGMLPATVDGPAPPAGSPNPFVMFEDDSWGFAPQDRLQLWRFHADWSNPASSTFSGPNFLPTAPFDSRMCNDERNCIPQPGTNRKVDAIPDRLMYRLQYRNFGTHESLVVNHTVNTGNDHAGIRWYEIRNPFGIPAIHQQSTYAPDADNRWMGSAAMDGSGNMALGFSVSSNNTFPSVRYAGRLAVDPSNTLAQGETQLVAGSGSQTDSTGRWGDYSSMSVDPVDHCTFWYTQEYYSTTSGAGWRTRIGAFAYPSCATNATSVTITAVPSQAQEAGPTSATFNVSRTGSTASDLTVNFAVTGTAVAGTDYVAIPASVTIPAGASSATVEVMPIQDSLVELDKSVVAALTPNPAYSVGTPSSATILIINDDLPPDLVISSLVGPATGGAGLSISVTDTTSNTGGGAAEPSVTRFYISSNSTLDANDISIGERAVPALAPGVSSSATTTLLIPAGTAGGNQYIIAKADADDLLLESSDDNNTKFSLIQIGSDMVVTAFTAPTMSGAGLTITVTDTTKNQGGAPADASVTRFYLSTNLTLDGGDPSMGERAVPVLAPGASDVASTSFAIPAVSTGNYYLIAVADADNALSESLEGNNSRAASIRIGPDVMMQALTVPSSAAAGATISISDTTKNLGGGASQPTITRFYLSTDTVLSASDTLLGERAIPALQPSAVNSGSITATLPSGIGGNFQIIAKADADDSLPETIESNNTRYSSIQIGPDLAIIALSGPAAAAPGASISVTDTTKNQGGGTAGISVTRFYLSTNAVLDAADVFLNGRSVPALGAGATNSGTTALTIPAGTATAIYSLIAKSDALDAVDEIIETNNTRLISIRIGPDLVVSALTVPTSAAAGANFVVTDSTLNQGGGTTGPTKTRFYLSTNTVLDAADVPLGERSISSLSAGVPNSASTTLTIPAGTASGLYQIIAQADADNAVAETLETNNLRTAAMQIGPDLIVVTISAPSTVVAGATFTVTDNTKNQGGGPAGSSVTRFFLSTNTLLDASDVTLGERAIPALAVGITNTGSISISIPAGTTPRTYYLFAKADAGLVVSESVENNNLRLVVINVVAN